jgi:hypothetical protein
MSEFNTLYIFGRNRVNLVDKGINITKDYNSVHSIISLVLNIYQQKPADLDIPNEFNNITIVNGSYAQFNPSDKNKPMFRINFDKIQPLILDGVITDMKS